MVTLPSTVVADDISSCTNKLLAALTGALALAAKLNLAFNGCKQEQRTSSEVFPSLDP